MFILVAGVVPLAAAINIRQRESDGKEKSITISAHEIGIKHRYKLFRISKEEFMSFDGNIRQIENRFVGTIYVKTNNERSYEFLELFNSNPSFIASDIESITTYLQHYFGDAINE